jgi:hypothetical protein
MLEIELVPSNICIDRRLGFKKVLAHVVHYEPSKFICLLLEIQIFQDGIAWASLCELF